MKKAIARQNSTKKCRAHPMCSKFITATQKHTERVENLVVTRDSISSIIIPRRTQQKKGKVARKKFSNGTVPKRETKNNLQSSKKFYFFLY